MEMLTVGQTVALVVFGRGVLLLDSALLAFGRTFASGLGFAVGLVLLRGTLLALERILLVVIVGVALLASATGGLGFGSSRHVGTELLADGGHGVGRAARVGHAGQLGHLVVVDLWLKSGEIGYMRKVMR